METVDKEIDTLWTDIFPLDGPLRPISRFVSGHLLQYINTIPVMGNVKYSFIMGLMCWFLLFG